MTDEALGGGASALAPTSSSSAFSDDAPSKFTSGFEEEWEMTQDEWNEYKMMFRSFACLSALRLTFSTLLAHLALHTVCCLYCYKALTHDFLVMQFYCPQHNEIQTRHDTNLSVQECRH